MIRVLLADKHQLLHAGIRAILSATDDITLIDTATCHNQLRQLYHEKKPDIILLALNVAESPCTDLLNFIQQSCPTVKMAVLLHDSDEVCLHQLLDHDVAGVILKSDTPETLAEAIRAVAAGQVWFSSALSPQFWLRKKEQSNKLSGRELEVLRLTAEEKTDKEIAQTLQITERTVRYHLESINIKLSTSTRTGAVAEAIRHKLIQ
jgi:DNA-binding NarL/FixJ family response regulator